jgi:hypothetical protein
MYYFLEVKELYSVNILDRHTRTNSERFIEYALAILVKLLANFLLTRKVSISSSSFNLCFIGWKKCKSVIQVN